jgi:hypothetical protein
MATYLERNISDSVPVSHFSSDQWELAWTILMNQLFFTSISQKMSNSTIENSDKHSRQTTNQISHLIAAEPSFVKTSIGGQKQ